MEMSYLDEDQPSSAGEVAEHRSAKRSRPTINDLRAVQPPRLSEGRIGLLYREASLPLVWLFVRAGVTANQVTLLWIAVGVLGLGLLASGNYWLVVLGALCLQLVILLDRADGDVARYCDNRTFYGKYLDLAGHTLIKSLLFFCVGLGVFATRPHLWVLYLGVSGALAMSVGTHLRFYRAYLLVIRNLKFHHRSRAKNRAHTMVRKLENLWRTPGLAGVIALGAITNQMVYILIFYGVATPFWALIESWRISRELRACDSDPSQRQPDKVGLDAYD